MSRPVKIIFIFISVLGALWIIGRLTKAIQFYSIPTPSNEPTIKIGNYIIASNLIEPRRFNFICYKAHSGSKVYTNVHRLCGLEGDTVELRSGVFFVNGKSSDSLFTLSHNYWVANSDGQVLEKALIQAGIQDNQMMTKNDSFLIICPDQIIESNRLKARRFYYDSGYEDERIGRTYSEKWNSDFFGPIVVPKGKYFVLGDSRDNALDSRYIGFIDISNWVGTVVGK